ncbi:protein NLP1-like [Zingiber officinale]|uniref:protein NLP1-like n=1 Tax=Zingiber officinale TaxID=94328 RepID=UPI001C4BABB3|nr:protein NLP1-like [Zingiber officinale]
MTSAPPLDASSAQSQRQHQILPPKKPQTKSATLIFDEISKLFSLPIAEAAPILGVCTSVLKKVCRDYGIVRWPYRKFLAGKTVDDIRRDVAKERPEILDVSKTTNQRNLVSKVISSPSGSLSTSTGYPAQDPPKMQQVSLTVNASPQGNRFIQNGLPMNQSKHIPTFMDEFKYGFPTNGLSSHSVKWWGVSGHEDADGSLPGETAVEKDENQEMQELSNDDEDPDSGAEDNDAESKPSALLCSLRRKAVDYGRESLGIGIPNRLTKKQKLTLTQVFGSSLTESWSINFS